MDNLNVDELLKEYNAEQQPSGEDPEFEVKGKKYKASQIEEWERGYMRQADATKKWQEASELKKQAEAMNQEYNQLKNYIGFAIQKDPNLITYVQNLVAGQAQPGYSGGNNYSDDPYMKEIQALKQQTTQQMQQLWQWQQDTASRLNASQLEDEITELQSKYPRMDADKVLNAVAAQPTLDMEDLAKRSHEEMTQRVNHELKSIAEQRQRQRRAMAEGSGGRTAGMGRPAEPPKNREELERVVTERLKLLNGQ